jgi:hypothetical protein
MAASDSDGVMQNPGHYERPPPIRPEVTPSLER